MIKRLTFVSRADDVAPERFAIEWAGAVGDAAPTAGPVRVTLGTVIAELAVPGAPHDGVGVEWFADDADLDGRAGWLAQPELVDADQTVIVEADELVVRGGDWLASRWRSGDERLKHLALARRAVGLTPAEFSQAWQDHAGHVDRPGAVAPTIIPEPIRGQAYVQNHPRARATGEWAYDAVNEVWLDDLAAVAGRDAWLRANVGTGDAGSLFGPSTFLAVREHVVLDRS